MAPIESSLEIMQQTAPNDVLQIILANTRPLLSLPICQLICSKGQEYFFLRSSRRAPTWLEWAACVEGAACGPRPKQIYKLTFGSKFQTEQAKVNGASLLYGRLDRI